MKATLTIPTVEEIKERIIETLRDGVLEVEEEIVYNKTQNEYQLSASLNVSEHCILSIEEINGYDEDGQLVTTKDIENRIKITEGVDYELYYDDVVYVEGGVYSQSKYVGQQLYKGIRFLTSDLFRDNSTIRVRYKYFDASKMSKITNFNKGTVANLIVEGLSTVIKNIYDEMRRLYEDTWIDTAEGEALDKLASLYSITRQTGSKSSGEVYVENIGSDTLTITSKNIFATEGTDPIKFKMVGSEQIIIDVGQGVYIPVESVEIGKDNNVGVGTIVKIYEDNTLSTELQGYKCYNPPYKEDGSLNYFDNGQDVETDEELRGRIKGFIKSKMKGRTEAVIEELKKKAYVSTAKLFDWEEIKTLSNSEVVAVIVREGNKLISKSELYELKDVLKTVMPMGIKTRIIRPMLMYVDIDLNVEVKYEYWLQKDDIENTLKTNIINLVNSLELGEDLNEGRIIATVLRDNRIKDVTVTDIKITTYSYDPYVLEDMGQQIWDSENSIATTVGQTVYLTAQRAKMYVTYDGTSTHIDAPTEHQGKLVDRANEKPSVYLVLKDDYGKYYRHPSFTIDYINSTTPIDSTGFNIDPSNGATVHELQSGDLLCVDYYYVKYTQINGIRFKLYFLSVPTTDVTLNLELIDKDFTTTISTTYTLTSSSIVQGVNEVEIDWDVDLLTNIMAGDPNSYFWLKISVDTTTPPDADIYLVTSESNDEEFFLTQVETRIDDITLVSNKINKRIPLKLFVKRSKIPSYFIDNKSIEVVKNFYKPEVMKVNNINVTMELYSDV